MWRIGGARHSSRSFWLSFGLFLFGFARHTGAIQVSWPHFIAEGWTNAVQAMETHISCDEPVYDPFITHLSPGFLSQARIT